MTATKPKILVIDDTPVNLLTLGAALKDEFDLQFASTGQDGIDLALQGPPDLILLDIMMPELDGFETCIRLKRHASLRETPIIFITAMMSAEAEVRGLELGALDYITKPVQVTIARQRIRNLLERDRLRMQVQTQRDALEHEMSVRQQSQHQVEKLLMEQKAILESSPVGIVRVAKRVIQWANPAFEKMLGYAPGELVGKPTRQNYLSEQAYLNLGDIAYAQMQHSGSFRTQLEHVRKDGQVLWVDMSGTWLDADAGESLWSFLDVTEKHATEQKLKLAANVFVSAREGIMITDIQGKTIDVNAAFTDITGYTREDVMGQSPRLLQSGLHDQAFYANFWQQLKTQGHWNGEIWNRHKSGAIYPEMLNVTTVYDEQGAARNYVAMFSDISKLKAHESELENLANFDALTKLPKRSLLADRLRQGMTQAVRRQQKIAVLYLDLDGFKAVNDTYGHDVGDLLLVSVSSHLRQTLRSSDTLARVGGDEFVAVLVDLETEAASLPMLKRLIEVAAQPVAVGKLELRVSASVGVTFYPQEQEMAGDQLIRQADHAMYLAKSAGKNCYRVFDKFHESIMRELHENLGRVRQGLNDSEFTLYYQPKVNMRTGTVVGLEAMIRWNHPVRGVLEPAVFLDIIEESPLAIEVGEWVIETALTEMDQWRSRGLELPLSVNVGSRQLHQPNFVARLRDILKRHPLFKRSFLQLEVQENSALDEFVEVAQTMEQCKMEGVDFALDDFGLGHSTLTYLRRLPVKILKLDQTFVHGILQNQGDREIAEAVIRLAEVFGRSLIAEGVETAEQGAQLMRLGCDVAQGYFIAPPMPAGEVLNWQARYVPCEMWMA